MKHIIPVVSNNTNGWDVEFFIEDDSSDENETVTLALRPTSEDVNDAVYLDENNPSLYATVKTDDLLKTLEWLKSWSRR